MIVSFCPGRIRLRFAELKNPTVSGEVVARIQAVTGITKAEVNQRTGSLLVEYDTKVLPTEKLLEMSKTAGFDIFLK